MDLMTGTGLTCTVPETSQTTDHEQQQNIAPTLSEWPTYKPWRTSSTDGSCRARFMSTATTPPQGKYIYKSQTAVRKRWNQASRQPRKPSQLDPSSRLRSGERYSTRLQEARLLLLVSKPSQLRSQQLAPLSDHGTTDSDLEIPSGDAWSQGRGKCNCLTESELIYSLVVCTM